MVATSVWPESFPNCMAPCISELPRRIWHDTSKGNSWERIVNADCMAGCGPNSPVGMNSQPALSAA